MSAMDYAGSAAQKRREGSNEITGNLVLRVRFCDGLDSNSRECSRLLLSEVLQQVHQNQNRRGMCLRLRAEMYWRIVLRWGRHLFQTTPQRGAGPWRRLYSETLNLSQRTTPPGWSPADEAPDNPGCSPRAAPNAPTQPLRNSTASRSSQHVLD
jgi:hypothetical protein